MAYADYAFYSGTWHGTMPEADFDKWADRASLEIDRVTFDPRSGRLAEIIRYEKTPRQQRLRGWFYAFHTGTWGGIWTKILYFLAALTGASLPLTGYWLWWRRCMNKRK